MDYDTFIGEVQNRGQLSSREDAVHHARAVMDVVADAVSAGALADVRSQISSADEWNELFVLVDQEAKPVDEEQRSQ